MFVDKAIEEMKLVFKDIPYGIDHTSRVLHNAEIITEGEAISGATRETISLAAILHDIGAIEAQKKHGSMEGHFQEIEGPSIAQSILERAGVLHATISRVCYIVGNHHTPSKIDGIDFQVLWEAESERACALTRYELQVPSGPAFESHVAELFEVRDGKIKSLDIYFDSAPFPK